MSVAAEQGLARLAATLRASAAAVRAAAVRARAQGFVPGALVCGADRRLGVVRELNTSTFGFFTGDAYPVLIERDGLVVEYALEPDLRVVREGDRVRVTSPQGSQRGCVQRAEPGALQVCTDGNETLVYDDTDGLVLEFEAPAV